MMKIRTNIGFRITIHQRGGGLLTKPKAGTRLDGQSPFAGRLTGLNIIMSTEVMQKSIRPF